MNPDPTSLDRLHDVIAPPPAPWWPPAPGWIWVLGLLSIIAVAAAACALHRWQCNRYRREALAELARQEAALADPARRVAALAVMAELLKRAALSAWPRPQIAGLIGEQWAVFLKQSGALETSASATMLARAAYDPRTASGWSDDDLKQVVEFVRHWLVHHRTERWPKEAVC